MSNLLLSSLSRDFTKLFESGEDCDFSVQVKEESNTKIYHLHRVILRARCPFFATALKKSTTTEGTEQNTYQKLIEKWSPTILDVIFRYIYGGTISPSDFTLEQLFDLVAAADDFQISELTGFLEDYLVKEKPSQLKNFFGKTSNIARDRPSLTKMSEFCATLLQNEPESVFAAHDFRLLGRDAIISLLKQESILLDEIEIWQKVAKWGIAQNPELPAETGTWSPSDYENLKNTLKPCIELIRFNNISSADFFEKIVPFQPILPNPLFQDLLGYYLRPGYSPTMEMHPRRKSQFLDGSVLLQSHQAAWLSKCVRLDMKASILPELIPTDSTYISHEFKLLARGSRDGFTAQDFHRLCDNKGPTITVIKVEFTGQLVGGYNPVSWKSQPGHAPVDNSFIFSLGSASSPGIILSRVTDKRHLMVNSACFGPRFGMMGDLKLYENFKSKTGGSCSKNQYRHPIMKGAENSKVCFSVYEYEVFQVVNKSSNFFKWK